MLFYSGYHEWGQSGICSGPALHPQFQAKLTLYPYCVFCLFFQEGPSPWNIWLLSSYPASQSQFIEPLSILEKESRQNSTFSMKPSQYFIGWSEVECFAICVLNARLCKALDLPAKLTLYLALKIVLSLRDSINYNLLILFSVALVSFFPEMLIRHIFWGKKKVEVPWYIGFTLASWELGVRK